MLLWGSFAINEVGRQPRQRGMKTGAAAERLFRGTTSFRTLGAWLEWAVAAYARLDIALGQIATDAHDEALYLLLRTLDLPLDVGY